ncbi:hypothetical protein C8J56DRAFT_893307 [Mycena floridula]|nr:hypothetical protein C8J56DRAFT_893307 [Mycena floridula]
MVNFKIPFVNIRQWLEQDPLHSTKVIHSLLIGLSSAFFHMLVRQIFSHLSPWDFWASCARIATPDFLLPGSPAAFTFAARESTRLSLQLANRPVARPASCGWAKLAMSTQEMIPPFQRHGLIQRSPALPHSASVLSNFAQSGSNVLHLSDSFDPNRMVTYHLKRPASSTYSMPTPSYTTMDFVLPGPSGHWFVPSQNIATATWISPANQAQSTAGPSHFSNVEPFSFPSINNLYTVPVEPDIPGAQTVDDP